MKNTLEIREYASISDFAEACHEWLELREDYYNGLISTSDQIMSGCSVFQRPFWYASVHKDDRIVGCCIHAEPDGLLVSELPTNCIDDLASLLLRKVGIVRRVIGHSSSSKLVALAYSRLLKSSNDSECNWNVYRLDKKCVTSDQVLGTLRICDFDDRELVASWGHDYGVEVPAPIDVEQFMLRKLDDRLLYIWSNGKARAMATISARTKNGISISSVYTPKEYRRQGYASATVKALSNHLLTQDCQFITLSAVAGHDSEKIYRDIGYRMIGSRSSYIFRK